MYSFSPSDAAPGYTEAWETGYGGGTTGEVYQVISIYQTRCFVPVTADDHVVLIMSALCFFFVVIIIHLIDHLQIQNFRTLLGFTTKQCPKHLCTHRFPRAFLHQSKAFFVFGLFFGLGLIYQRAWDETPRKKGQQGLGPEGQSH